ncbi:OsmC family protein [Pseudonocardia acaciae]|uniref:OsmC family protein n=1 Tax=Pseudonocardia acaciae TaxID=551276 RepID=UPI0014703476|nr:OsmC family protein [Pseudonocardia acaciae]
MSDYTVRARHTGALSFEVSNGRATLGTEWNPADGSWLATELFLAGVGACMLATLVDYAQHNNIDVTGAGVTVSAESATRPVRMSEINVTYELPEGLSQAHVDALVRAGDRCKVHNTIAAHPTFSVSATTRTP